MIFLSVSVAITTLATVDFSWCCLLLEENEHNKKLFNMNNSTLNDIGIFRVRWKSFAETMFYVAAVIQRVRKT